MQKGARKPGPTENYFYLNKLVNKFHSEVFVFEKALFHQSTLASVKEESA